MPLDLVHCQQNIDILSQPQVSILHSHIEKLFHAVVIHSFPNLWIYVGAPFISNHTFCIYYIGLSPAYAGKNEIKPIPHTITSDGVCIKLGLYTINVFVGSMIPPQSTTNEVYKFDDIQRSLSTNNHDYYFNNSL